MPVGLLVFASAPTTAHGEQAPLVRRYSDAHTFFDEHIPILNSHIIFCLVHAMRCHPTAPSASMNSNRAIPAPLFASFTLCYDGLRLQRHGICCRPSHHPTLEFACHRASRRSRWSVVARIYDFPRQFIQPHDVRIHFYLTESVSPRWTIPSCVLYT